MARFPDGFVFGAATAAYQVEGAVDEDGRGPSIWDTFCRVPDAIAGGDTGDVACDNYHRWPEDVALMASLGLGAYRFSIAWPRVQPDGAGPANQKGLDHYRRLVEGLRERGIVPYVTLYHWDLPQALQDRGGWPARDTAYRFADYTAIVRDALGDVVDHWATLNEPKVASHAGYGDGIHAPGIRDRALRDRAAHHLLLAHGLGLSVLRGSGEVGITLDLSPVRPMTGSPEDAAAAAEHDYDNHGMFLEPVLRGRSRLGADLVRDGDLDLISAPIDYLGVNYYRPLYVTAGPRAVVPPGVPVTAVDWPIVPSGLRDLLVGLREAYPDVPPIHITENGAAFDDEVGPDGSVDDPARVAYLHSHLLALHEAIEAGVDVRGYFVWTLLDNFEWAEGYAKRFGIVRVDQADLTRRPKASAHWYGQVARTGAVPRPGPEPAWKTQ
ncbi:GH1 family beta-glucosidase [Phytohabitans flavus]